MYSRVAQAVQPVTTRAESSIARSGPQPESPRCSSPLLSNAAEISVRRAFAPCEVISRRLSISLLIAAVFG